MAELLGRRRGHHAAPGRWLGGWLAAWLALAVWLPFPAWAQGRIQNVFELIDVAVDVTAETVSKLVMVLPVFQSAGALILWDDPNPWRDAWASRPKKQGLVPTLLPLGDLADMASIGAEQAMDGDRQRLNAIAGRYGASDTLVVFGVLRVDA